MKKLFSFVVIAAFTLAAFNLNAQDKSKRPSPPAKVEVTTTKGVKISIDYSQPSVKGRQIGKEIAPFGKVWRTGANEATVFEIDKDVIINNKKLKTGKYGFYTIPGEKEWIIIFNNKSNLWGDDGYNQADDALRLVAKPGKSAAFSEKMTFTLNANGKVALIWGDTEVNFKVD